MAEAGLSSWFNLGVELLNFRLFKRRLRGKSNGEWTGADIKVVVSLQLHLAWTTLVAEKEPEKTSASLPRIGVWIIPLFTSYLSFSWVISFPPSGYYDYSATLHFSVGSISSAG